MPSQNAPLTLPPNQPNKPSGIFPGVPSFIRARCRTAATGGSGGYAEAGFHLGRHVHELEPLDLETDEWVEVIVAELQPLVDAEVIA